MVFPHVKVVTFFQRTDEQSIRFGKKLMDLIKLTSIFNVPVPPTQQQSVRVLESLICTRMQELSSDHLAKTGAVSLAFNCQGAFALVFGCSRQGK